MFVGVDLDSVARAKGPRERTPPPQLNLPVSSASKADKPRRSKSFTPPSARLTQPTKSQQRRQDSSQGDAGAQSSRSSRGGASARGGGGGGNGGSSSARASTQNSERKHAPSPSARTNSPFGTPGGSTSRARIPAYVARLSAHERTHSPSGRFHPDSLRRREIRQADISANIDYYAPGGAPDNDRKSKEASWLCSQAFIESLRVYPDPFEARPIRLPGESVAFDGNTQSPGRPHTEHEETAMRRRLSIAPADGEWLPHQLPIQWPDHIQEGTWRGVGPLIRGEEGQGPGRAAAGMIGRFFSGKGSSSRLGRGDGSSRAAAAGAATSPTSAYTSGHESSAFGSSGAWGSASKSTPRSPKTSARLNPATGEVTSTGLFNR